ncbi:MAG: nitroreductase family protein [Bacteroidales bacterium]|nr:nitroreductase family protein [Bacteroidales bacterium]
MIKITMAALAASLMLASCGNKGGEVSHATSSKDIAIENILNRKSVRNYLPDTAIAPEVMEGMLRCAMAAPTGMDKRPWRFVVVNNTAAFDTILDESDFNRKMYLSASAVVIFCADTTSTRQDSTGTTVVFPNPIWRDDMGACVENFLLAAEANGLGACWTACYPFAERMAPIKKVFGLPNNVQPYALVAIGYPAGMTQPKDKWKPENIHYDRW